MYATSSTFPSTVISDAFEAATNGMHNPEAFARLESLEADQNWKNIIYAIRAFYNQDFGLMNNLLISVDPGSDAGRLVRVLRHMAGTEDYSGKLTKSEERLALRVTENTRFLNSAVRQLKESIDYGEELFTETASLLIKEVKQKTPVAAGRLALWSFRICIEKGFDDEALADNILMLFGQAEGLRLIALSLMETEPESALICFTRSLIRRIMDKTINKTDAAAYMEVIEALLTACAENDPVIIDISELLSMLESELNLYFGFPSISMDTSPAAKISAMIKHLTISSDPVYTEELQEPEPAEVKLARVSKNAVQLELF